MPYPTGHIINGRYRIVSLLGQGGFGAVYRAWDLNLKRPCALKENLETDSQSREQFEKEATILANLSHQYLPRVTDHFNLPGQGQYLIMDFIDGQDLEQMLKQQGKIDLESAMRWIVQVAEALEYLHTRSIPVIHRDIKPANIRIAPDGNAYLVDFGLVKLYHTKAMTSPGARGVTPGFSPSEQYAHGATDARTDIYALGATFYNLITAVIPPESVDRAIKDTLVPAHLVNPNIPVHLSAIISQSMALNPQQRFQNTAQFITALKNPENHSTIVIPDSSKPGLAAAQTTQTPSTKSLISGITIGFSLMGIILIVAVLIFGFSLFPRIMTLLDDPTPTSRARNPGSTASMEPSATTEEISIELTSTPKPPEPTDVASTPQLTTDSTLITRTPSPTPTTATIDILASPITQGRWIAYAYGPERDKLDIYRLNIDTGEREQLTSDQWMDESPVFSPDGNSIVYVSCRGECELYQIDFHTSRSIQLTNLPVTIKFPNYCRDINKSWLTFEGRSGNTTNIWMLDLSTGEAQQLSFGNADSRPVWSPDCTQIAFGRASVDTDRNGSITSADYLDLHILTLASGQVRQLQTTDDQDEFNFAWSPNGEWIAFCRVSEDTDNNGFVNLNDRSDLYVIRPDGSGENSIIRNNLSVFSPSWSPDGKALVFSAYRGSNRQEFWIYNLESGDFSQLTETGPYYHPEWSP